MISPRSGARVLAAALTCLAAIAAHTIVHAVGAGEAFVLATPAHAVMLAVALVALALGAQVCGLGHPAAEVRRRSALIRAAARTDGSLIRAGALQALLVTGLLVAENASIAPGRLAEAIVCGALASLFAAFAVRALRVGLPRAIAALHAVHRAVARVAAEFAAGEPARAPRLAYARSRPARAPPIR